MQSLIALKPYILLVFAIATGLFVRTVGQWILDWAKAPSEMAKSRVRQEVSKLDPADPAVRAVHDASWSVVMPPSGVPL